MIAVIFSAPTHVGDEVLAQALSRLPAISLFLFFWHPRTWGWMADTQEINSLCCPFACAMFVGRGDVYTGHVPKGVLLGGHFGTG